MKVVYFGYLIDPLRALLDSSVEVQAVVVEPSRSRTHQIIEYCDRHHVQWVASESVKRDPYLTGVLDEGIAVGVVGAFGQRIPLEMLSKTTYGFCNIHFSYLPHYRGNNPIEWMILRGEPSGGVTLHWMSEEFDEGPIISQVRVPLYQKDDYGAYFNRCSTVSYELMKSILAQPIRNWPRISQDKQLGSSFPKRSEVDAKIGPESTFEQVNRLVRAEGWKKIVHFIVHGHRYVVKTIQSVDVLEEPVASGTIVSVNPDIVEIVLDRKKIKFTLDSPTHDLVVGTVLE